MAYDNHAHFAEGAGPAGPPLPSDPGRGVPSAESVPPGHQRLDASQSAQAPSPYVQASQAYAPQAYAPQAYAPQAYVHAPSSAHQQSYYPPVAYMQPAALPAPTKKRNRGVLILAAALGVALIAAGSVFALNLFGGHRPSEALPANSVLYAEMNLEPGLDQLAAGAMLLQKIPQATDAQGGPLQMSASGTPKEQLFNLLAGGVMGFDINYADVEPWLGDRVGVAILPGTSATRVQLAVAVAVKDSAAAMQALPALLATSSAVRMTATPVGDRFVVITESADAARVADDLRAGTLAEDANFTRVAATMDKGKILSFYGDGTKALALAGTLTNQAVPSSASAGLMTGNLNLTPDYAELTTDGVDGPKVDLKTGAYELAAAVGGTPSAVLALSDSGSALEEAWASLPSAEQRTLIDSGRSFGLSLPADLPTVFGERTAIAAYGSGRAFGLVSQGAQRDQTRQAWGKLATALRGTCNGCVWDISSEADRVAVAVTPYGGSTLRALNVLRGTPLSSNSAFTKAVPNGPATAVLFADTSALTDMGPTMPKLAVGVTSTGTKDGQSRSVVRVVPLG